MSAERETGGAGAAPAVSVRDVCFAYGANEALHNVSFELPPRSLTAVVGPNGGGKTTLLRLLLGDLRPKYGEIRVLGEPPERARRRVGFVPQSIVFDPDFPISVLEAVMLGRAADRVLGGFSRADREAADAALERVGLAGFGARPFAALSGGQRQRVAIAQALCAGPELLLLDEPTANVDRRTETDLHALFAELAREATVVLVSHNLSVVAAHATHLLCVNRGADLHAIGAADSETRLEPLSGGVAFVHNLHPDHVEELLARLDSPHHGEAHRP